MVKKKDDNGSKCQALIALCNLSFFEDLCKMLTEEEEKFLIYWEENKVKEKSLFKQLSLGLPIGLLIGVGILLNFISGWYTRATMVANSQSTPLVLILAIVIIAIFCSIFYKQHQWEMNDQRFQELMKKKELQNSSQQVQQKPFNDSQVSK